MKAFRKAIRMWRLNRFGDDEVKSIKILRVGVSIVSQTAFRNQLYIGSGMRKNQPQK